MKCLHFRGENPLIPVGGLLHFRFCYRFVTTSFFVYVNLTVLIQVIQLAYDQQEVFMMAMSLVAILGLGLLALAVIGIVIAIIHRR